MSAWVLFALAGVVCVLVLRQANPAFAWGVGVFCACGVLVVALGEVDGIRTFLEELSNSAGLEKEYYVLLLKALGIGYLCQFGGEFCKDAGESGLASAVEILGKVCVLCLMLEPAMDLLGLVSAMLKG